MIAALSQYLFPLLSAVAVAAVGGGVTLYQVHTIGRRASARDDYQALWAEVRLRDADADRLRTEVNAQFDTIKRLREENMALDAELTEARAQVLRLTNQFVRMRSERGENDVNN